MLRTESVWQRLYSQAVKQRRLMQAEGEAVVAAALVDDLAFSVRGRSLLQLLASYHPAVREPDVFQPIPTFEQAFAQMPVIESNDAASFDSSIRESEMLVANLNSVPPMTRPALRIHSMTKVH